MSVPFLLTPVTSVMCGCPLRVKVDELRWAGEQGCGHVSGL
jgi:hypothetical protein